MEKGRSRNQLAWLAWLLCILACSAWSESVARFNVSQTAVRLPNITAYVNILDKDGQPATGVKANISATLDGHGLPLTDLKSFDESGEGVAYFFLVDISKSIRPAQFNAMRQAMGAWIDGLHPVDRLAIATFGNDYRLLRDFTGDKETAKAALESLGPSDGKTLLHLALQRALEVSRRTDKNLPTRRVVVVLSDGKDEGSGITVEDLRPQIQASHLPIYAIGFSNLPGEEKQYYLDVLHRLASLSGGSFREAASASLAQDYAEMNGSIRRVFVARFSCSGCQLSEKTSSLKIDLTSGPVAVNDTVSVALEWVPWSRRIPSWAYVIAVFAVAGIVLMLFALSRKKPSAPVSIPERPVFLEQTRPTPVAGLPVKLATVKGSDVGRVHEVRLVERAHIGRARDCDVVLGDVEVSGRHCDLVLSNGRVMVHDLGSTNGILVNGARVVKQARLESGDLIYLGRTELRISIGEAQ
jgi:Mg-chelatase subunit ChlD